MELSDESQSFLGLDKETLAKYRCGQNKFRIKLINRWGERCVVTKFSVGEALRASHIKPWADSDPKERLDENNGLLLTATLDALFDQHLISFDDDGRIIIYENNQKIESYFQKMGIDLQTEYFRPTRKMKSYLAGHRKKCKNRLQNK